jgi:hypothetical protein
MRKIAGILVLAVLVVPYAASEAVKYRLSPTPVTLPLTIEQESQLKHAHDIGGVVCIGSVAIMMMLAGIFAVFAKKYPSNYLPPKPRSAVFDDTFEGIVRSTAGNPRMFLMTVQKMLVDPKHAYSTEPEDDALLQMRKAQLTLLFTVTDRAGVAVLLDTLCAASDIVPPLAKAIEAANQKANHDLMLKGSS